MAEIITQPITLTQLVDLMTQIRRKGDESVIKRSNFTDFPELNTNIEFVKENYIEFASYGYIERLIRKLAAENTGEKAIYLKITHYSEACGFFSGKALLYLDAANRELFQEIQFAWQGKGEIETTWNNFTTWEVVKKQNIR